MKEFEGYFTLDPVLVGFGHKERRLAHVSVPFGPDPSALSTVYRLGEQKYLNKTHNKSYSTRQSLLVLSEMGYMCLNLSMSRVMDWRRNTFDPQSFALWIILKIYWFSVWESPFDLQSLDRRCIGRLLDFKLADRARIIKALNQSTTVWSYIFWFRGMDVVELDSEEMIQPAGWEQQQLCAAIDVAQSFEWMDSLDLRANSASPTSQ